MGPPSLCAFCTCCPPKASLERKSERACPSACERGGSLLCVFKQTAAGFCISHKELTKLGSIQMCRCVNFILRFPPTSCLYVSIESYMFQLNQNGFKFRRPPRYPFPTDSFNENECFFIACEPDKLAPCIPTFSTYTCILNCILLSCFSIKHSALP